MGSVSFSDLVIDKVFSISSKMKENSFKQGSSLCLMGDKPNYFSLEFEDLVTGIGIICPPDFNTYNSVKKSKVDYPLVKNLDNTCSNKFNFSPHLFNVVHNSLRYLSNQADLLFSTQNSSNISNMLCELALIKPPAMPNTYSDSDSELNSVKETASTARPLEQAEIMSITIKNTSVRAKSNIAVGKVNVPNCLTLNLQLTNRKTKELQKRSKKRRRRQKKVLQIDGSCSQATKPVMGGDKLLTSPKSSPRCHSNNSKSDSQFIVAVKQQGHTAPFRGSSFVIAVSSLSDEESDWDACSENDISTETADFEFPGLVVANFSTSTLKSCFQSSHSFNVCSFTAYSQEEADEIAKLEAVLLQVNKNWAESTKGITDEPKLPSKVSFASDDKLVEVLPVEIYERKGEWELYASERLRFKRRICELEKIISPCLMQKHRLEIYSKLVQAEL